MSDPHAVVSRAVALGRAGAAATGVALLLVAALVRAQALAVPYVPTPPEVVHAMLAAADVGPDDVVMDLGSGDGRIVIAAARDFGARAVGVERDDALLERSRADAARAGVAARATFRKEDLYTTDLRDVSVLTMYLLPSVNLGMRMRILDQMAPGTRVVSHTFDMGDWEADRKIQVGASTIYLWRVPAQVAGRWSFAIPRAGARGAERTLPIEIQQDFQRLTARVVEPGSAVSIASATLDGTELTLVLRGLDAGTTTTLRGRVLGDLVSGTLGDGRFALLRRMPP